MAAAAAAAAALPDNFSGEEARLQLGNRLNDLSVAPDSAAAALAAAAVSLILTSAADTMEEWHLDDESEVLVIARMMLQEVYGFITGPSCSQIAVDALSLEIPYSVAKLGCLCLDLSAAEDIFERFASLCSPRDNVLILCEALDRHSSIQVVKSSHYFILLLDGIGKVLPLIQRHRAQDIKMAMPAVIGCVKYTASVLDEPNGRNAIDLFNAAFRFSKTVQMCKTMVDEEKEEATTVLGLFALQNIALISQSKQENSLSWGPLAIGYSQLAMASGFTWKGLLTGNDVRSAFKKTYEELDMHRSDFFSLAMEGAHLSGCIINPTTATFDFTISLFGCTNWGLELKWSGNTKTKMEMK